MQTDGLGLDKVVRAPECVVIPFEVALSRLPVAKSESLATEMAAAIVPDLADEFRSLLYTTKSVTAEKALTYVLALDIHGDERTLHPDWEIPLDWTVGFRYRNNIR